MSALARRLAPHRGRLQRRLAIRTGASLLWAAALGLGLLSGVAGAQERPRPAPPGGRPFVLLETDRPVLGVYLAERCERVGGIERPCPEPPLIRAVETGGPADRADVHPGDTLMAVDGKPLTTPQGRRALASLEEGRPVRLTLGRVEGGARRVEVSPERMRPGRATMRVRTFRSGREGAPFPPAPAEGGEVVEFEIVELPMFEMRLPGDARALRVGSLEAALAAGGAPPGGAVVYFLGDSAGAVRIGAWGPDSLRILVAPQPEAGAGGPRPAVRAAPPHAARARPAGPPPPGAYVWQNPELARRLEVVRDSVGRAVRTRLDSLRHLRHTWEEGEAPAAESIHVEFERLLRWRREAAGGAGAPQPRVSASQVEALLLPEARVAGAEFAPLTPGLAENFRGVSEGLLVLRVLPGTPAERLGLRDGDVVVEADGKACSGVHLLRAVLSRAANAGRPVKVKWIRKGKGMEGNLAWF